MGLLPSIGRWIGTETTPMCRLIACRALVDVGLLEEPLGSNRSPAIDGYLTDAGSPLGSSWCAAAVREWFQFANARVPWSGAGACETWHQMGKARGTLTDEPSVGFAVLYDFAGTGQADHMGVVVRVAPLILTVEGNTTLKRQTGSDREGVGATLAAIDHAHVLAYLIPEEVS